MSSSPSRILVLGSINLDEVFSVDTIVSPGETVSSLSYRRYLGGKGNNQAIALARAGAAVSFAGKIGPDGEAALGPLAEAGVDVARVGRGETPTGRAVIQVDREGENCIIVYGGANRDISPAEIGAMLEGWGAGDALLLQNEISSLAAAITLARDKGLRVYLNPSPADSSLLELPLHLVHCLVVNRSEAALLSGRPSQNGNQLIDALAERFPGAEVLLTLGADGALWRPAGPLTPPGGDSESADKPQVLMVAAARVKPVDTTAAGDTFTGYFIAARLRGDSPQLALREAAAASGICVTRPGAVPSIPERKEVLPFLS